jgi:hypothetical protein
LATRRGDDTPGHLEIFTDGGVPMMIGLRWWQMTRHAGSWCDWTNAANVPGDGVFWGRPSSRIGFDLVISTGLSTGPPPRRTRGLLHPALPRLNGKDLPAFEELGAALEATICGTTPV